MDRLSGRGRPKDIWYATNHVAVVPVAGGAPPRSDRRPRPQRLSARASPRRQVIYFLSRKAATGIWRASRPPAAPVERVVDGERAVQRLRHRPEGRDRGPGEHAAAALRGLGWSRAARCAALTTSNDDFLEGDPPGRGASASRRRAPTARRSTPSSPCRRTRKPGAKLPTILRIHGGPTSQYNTAFNLEWQMLAAHGYAVVAANPRGSSGYGRDFSRAIWADWGNKDFEDVMAAVDQAIAMGVADPDRLGVGGWSYGGILTDHVITKTTASRRRPRGRARSTTWPTTAPTTTRRSGRRSWVCPGRTPSGGCGSRPSSRWRRSPRRP